jgi:acyl dehydratase
MRPQSSIESIAGLRDCVGREVAVSDWLEVTQERIDRFAEATGDSQWIHVDPERAARESPFGGTVAHGFLTLSLLVEMAKQAVSVGGVRLVVNYGLDRVRFVAPVPSGARIRGRFSLAALEDVRGGGVQATWSVTVEREGADGPCCVAGWLVRYYG